MRDIGFYRTQAGNCPVEEFLESISGKQTAKVTWVMQLISELEMVPSQYFKKLPGTDDLWEVSADIGRDAFRLLGFFDGPTLVIIGHAFAKKSQKIPRSDIVLTEQRKRDHFRRKKS